MSTVFLINDLNHLLKKHLKINLSLNFIIMTEIHNIKTLHQLLDEDTRRFTISEIELQNAIPKWIKKAGSVKLKTILQKYFDQIKHHVKIMDKFFEEENINYLKTSSNIMKVFISEADEKMDNCADAMVRDACILAAVQNINHFKISSYGTAAAFANTLGMAKTAVLFHECEVNEKQIDDRLSQLAEHEINKDALTQIDLPYVD